MFHHLMRRPPEPAKLGVLLTLLAFPFAIYWALSAEPEAPPWPPPATSVPNEGQDSPELVVGNSADVEAANHAFYEAFTHRDSEAMRGLWLQSQEDTVLRPGWMPARGWSSVDDVWRQYFQRTHFKHVTASDVRVRVQALRAEVACIETLELVTDAGVQVIQNVAFNIFKRQDDRWKLMIHKATATAAPR